MDLSNYIVGGAALGGVIGFWNQIKSVLWRFCSFFLQRVEFDPRLHVYVISGLIDRGFVPSFFRDQSYKANAERVSDGSVKYVGYEDLLSKPVFFWKGAKFIFVSSSNSGPIQPARGRVGIDRPEPESAGVARIIFPRGFLDVDAVVKDVVSKQNQFKSSHDQRFFISHIPDSEPALASSGTDHPWYSFSSNRIFTHDRADIGPKTSKGNALGKLVFPKGIQDLILEVKRWRDSRDWYSSKGIPWKRGWLMYGKPGSGKTAIARAFGEDLDLPIFVFNLAELDNHQLVHHWRNMQRNAPCIALIEDIDGVFHGRRNVAARDFDFMFGVNTEGEERPRNQKKNTGLLTFDCLLNCIDGVERSEGVFVIVTTNDISKVDPALGNPATDGGKISSRPGRLDRVIELSYMDANCRKEMARRILGEYPDLLQKVILEVDFAPDAKVTGSQWQDHCGSLALARHWEDGLVQEKAQQKHVAAKQCVSLSKREACSEVVVGL
jgi:hypothetical protein